MDKNIRDKLLTAVTDVLERFAFMFVEEEAGPETPVYHGEFLLPVITFSGPGRGILSIAVPAPLCEEIVANVLGEDGDAADPAMAEDALKELVNVICGELTVNLYGNKSVCNLTIPQIYRINREKQKELFSGPESVHLLVEGQPFYATLLLTEEK